MNAAGGTLILSGSNTGTGNVTLTAGNLVINNSNALGATASTLSINGGTIDSTVAGIINANANPISIGADFAFGGTNDLNLGTGAVTGFLVRTITLNGTGKTLTLGGVWGNTNDNNNTLTVNGAGNTLSLGGIALVNGGSTARTQTIAGTGNVMVTGAVTNGSSTGATQSLTITSSGTVTLAGNNTYNGLTTMNSATGTLVLSGSNTGTGGVTLTTGTLQLQNANAIQNSPLSLNGGTLQLRNDTNTTFASSGNITIGGSTTINVDRLTANGTGATLSLGALVIPTALNSTQRFTGGNNTGSCPFTEQK
jgi:autotransporter-associated beta strand protein